jgi:hypothetical protein
MMGRKINNMNLPEIKIQTDVVNTGPTGQVTVAALGAFPGGNVTVSSYSQDVNAFVISYDGTNIVIGSSAPDCQVMYRLVSKRVI